MKIPTSQKMLLLSSIRTRMMSFVAAGRKATSDKAVGKNAGRASEADAFNQLRAEVTPDNKHRTPTPATILNKMTPSELRKHEFIENTWRLYREKLYVEKCRELEVMMRKMEEACVELERTDVRLFKLALVKPTGFYFPIDRRLPTDTPPVDGWPVNSSI